MIVVSIPVHPLRLGQVVSNLVDNARSFSPPGGTVRITCRRLRNDVEIVVDDDGPGIIGLRRGAVNTGKWQDEYGTKLFLNLERNGNPDFQPANSTGACARLPPS